MNVFVTQMWHATTRFWTIWGLHPPRHRIAPVEAHWRVHRRASRTTTAQGPKSEARASLQLRHHNTLLSRKSRNLPWASSVPTHTDHDIGQNCAVGENSGRGRSAPTRDFLPETFSVSQPHQGGSIGQHVVDDYVATEPPIGVLP